MGAQHFSLAPTNFRVSPQNSVGNNHDYWAPINAKGFPILPHITGGRPKTSGVRPITPNKLRGLPILGAWISVGVLPFFVGACGHDGEFSCGRPTNLARGHQLAPNVTDFYRGQPLGSVAEHWAPNIVVKPTHKIAWTPIAQEVCQFFGRSYTIVRSNEFRVRPWQLLGAHK